MLNKVQLIGHLGGDPEVRSTQTGGKIASLSLATGDRWKDRDGNLQERTDWHRVVIFDPHLVEVAEKYARKGSRVYLEGQIQTRKYQDNSGQDRYVTEVVLQRFRSGLTLLDRTQQGERTEQRFGGGGEAAGGSQQTQRPAPAFDSDLDDDVPF